MQRALLLVTVAACASSQATEMHPAAIQDRGKHRATFEELLPASVRESIEQQARQQAQYDVRQAMQQGVSGFLPQQPPQMGGALNMPPAGMPATGVPPGDGSPWARAHDPGQFHFATPPMPGPPVNSERGVGDPMSPDFWMQPNGAAPGAKNPMAHILAAQRPPPGMEGHGGPVAPGYAGGMQPQAPMMPRNSGFGNPAGFGIDISSMGAQFSAMGGFHAGGIPGATGMDGGFGGAAQTPDPKGSCQCPEKATVPELLVMLNKLAIELQVRLNPGPNPYAVPGTSAAQPWMPQHPMGGGVGGMPRAGGSGMNDYSGAQSAYSLAQREHAAAMAAMHAANPPTLGEGMPRPAWAKPNPATLPRQAAAPHQAAQPAADSPKTPVKSGGAGEEKKGGTLAAEDALTASIEEKLFAALSRRDSGQKATGTEGTGSHSSGSIGMGDAELMDAILASVAEDGSGFSLDELMGRSGMDAGGTETSRELESVIQSLVRDAIDGQVPQGKAPQAGSETVQPVAVKADDASEDATEHGDEL